MARTVRVRRADAELRLPVEVGDYTDFLRLDRPRPERRPAVPSERSAAAELPASAGCLSGRSSSLVVSGAPVTPALRPAAHRGRRAAVVRADAAARRRGGAGRYVGAGNRRGRPIRLDDAERHVAGLCLVNDWSARDLQAWEAQPLGPFLSKSLATSLSRWLVPLDALAPFRCPAARPPDDPPPLPHLAPGERRRRRHRRHGGGLTRERRDAPPRPRATALEPRRVPGHVLDARPDGRPRRQQRVLATHGRPAGEPHHLGSQGRRRRLSAGTNRDRCDG